MERGLWGIANGTEKAPEIKEEDAAFKCTNAAALPAIQDSIAWWWWQAGWNRAASKSGARQTPPCSGREDETERNEERNEEEGADDSVGDLSERVVALEVKVQSLEQALESCQCASDLDGDGAVGFNDLVQLISDWGPCSA